eukprot:366223-Chlamydomonas_euryale.AAC.18
MLPAYDSQWFCVGGIPGSILALSYVSQRQRMRTSAHGTALIRPNANCNAAATMGQQNAARAKLTAPFRPLTRTHRSASYVLQCFVMPAPCRVPSYTGRRDQALPMCSTPSWRVAAAVAAPHPKAGFATSPPPSCSPSGRQESLLQRTEDRVA